MTKSDKNPSISIIVPALNEEGNLQGAVDCINSALGDRFKDHEIIIFDDASIDETGPIADGLKSNDPHIKVVHNPVTMGFGYNYTEGVRLAVMEYIMMVPGDNEIPASAISAVLARVGSADIVVPFTLNAEVRPWARRVISRAFTKLINTLFSLRLKYYNGTCCLTSALLKTIPITSFDFAYMASILVRLIKQGASYTEVGVEITSRPSGRTKAFALRNILGVLKTLTTLFYEVRISKSGCYAAPVRRVP